MAGLLSRERIVAGPGFNRWLVPPAALAIHLSIGQAYAFSVFKLPLTKVLGITDSAPNDWKQTELAWIFTIAIVFLGLSAAVFGRWLEHAGPRKSGFVAAVLLGARLLRLGARRPAAQHLAAVPGLRRARRMRAGAGLHHPGVHLDQVVSGPARDGDRDGDHGVRRRRHDRKPAVAAPARPLQVGHLRRRRRDVRHAGHHLPRGDALGRVPFPGAGSGVAAGGMAATPSRPSTGSSPSATFTWIRRSRRARSTSSGRCCS